MLPKSMAPRRHVPFIISTNNIWDYSPKKLLNLYNKKYNWKDEILKWEPSLRESQVQIIVKAADDIFHNTQVLICSYDIIPKIESKLIRLQPNIAIADEAHYLKNPVAKRTVAIVPLLQ